jgi:pimeloyl-ACP methyl ester carboxylesterase
MNRRTVVAASAVGILLGGLGLAEAAHAGLGSRAPQARASTPLAAGPAETIRWGGCSSRTMAEETSKDSTAVCGMLSVPLDYSHPTGTQIKLAVSMVRHTSAASTYQGAILVNPGGPGVPGLGTSSIGAHVPEGVGADYDWIGFDPRGVGASIPAITCEPTYFSGPRPPYTATTPAAAAVWLQRAAAYSASCARSVGPLLDHMTTVDWAKDMDSIRKALGQKQISYYGYSYGTYLGQVYATLFPTHLHRLVLDSNVDPRTVWYQANLNQDPAFEKNLNAWFTWLARYDSAYRLGRTPAAVRRLFFATQTALDKNPAGGEVGGDEWIDMFIYAGYAQNTWSPLALAFTEWVHDHDAKRLVAISKYFQTDMTTSNPGYLAVSCTDAAWPRSVAKNLSDTRRIAKSAPYLTWQNMWFNAPCLTWHGAAHTPVTVDGRAVHDALLVDQTGDAATPYEGSLEVRKLFPTSRLLALPGGTTHADSLSGDDCEDTTIAQYLATGALPARKAGNTADMTCEPLPPPTPTG